VLAPAKGAAPASPAGTGTGWPQPGDPGPRRGVTAAAGTEPAARDLTVPSRPAGRDRLAGRDSSAAWLRNASAGLAVLAAAAATVSFSAQYQMVYAHRKLPLIAGLEAAIPDAAALVFACLGVALALHGRRAVRARALNVTAVGTSVAMNALAAAPGWRVLAIWVMPPVAYALASDTLIGVVRAWALARHRDLRQAPGGEEATPLTVLGGLILWLLRLALAPASTLRGFRAWVITECPVAPSRRARPAPAPPRPARAAKPRRAIPASRPAAEPRTKTARFLALVAGRHGPLASIPLDRVYQICTELAPQVGLDTGAARAALRRAVLTAQNRSTP